MNLHNQTVNLCERLQAAVPLNYANECAGCSSLVFFFFFFFEQVQMLLHKVDSR